MTPDEMREKIRNRRSEAIRLRKRYMVKHVFSEGENSETVIEWTDGNAKTMYWALLLDAKLLNRQLKPKEPTP